VTKPANSIDQARREHITRVALDFVFDEKITEETNLSADRHHEQTKEESSSEDDNNIDQ
jgi:hypothetical protein